MRSPCPFWGFISGGTDGDFGVTMPISGILVPMLGTLSLQGGGRDPLFLGGGSPPCGAAVCHRGCGDAGSGRGRRRQRGAARGDTAAPARCPQSPSGTSAAALGGQGGIKDLLSHSVTFQDLACPIQPILQPSRTFPTQPNSTCDLSGPFQPDSTHFVAFQYLPNSTQL